MKKNKNHSIIVLVTILFITGILLIAFGYWNQNINTGITGIIIYVSGFVIDMFSGEKGFEQLKEDKKK